MRPTMFASHPLHYKAPLFRYLAVHPAVELEVLFRFEVGR